MRTIVVTGSESGLGFATARLLRENGDRVISVDRAEGADVVADLSSTTDRARAITEVRALVGGPLDGLATFAGIGGTATRPGSLLTSINYFGTVEFVEGLRDLLAQAPEPSVVVVASNTTTTTPAWSDELVEACLAGDEARAAVAADQVGSIQSYPITKTAIVRWMRKVAVTLDWIGEGIRINAIAPGVIETPLTDESKADPIKGPVFDKFPVPAGRLGRPEEIADFTQFLLSPKARFFVGSVLFCDGGTDALLRPNDWPTPAPAQLFG